MVLTLRSHILRLAFTDPDLREPLLNLLRNARGPAVMEARVIGRQVVVFQKLWNGEDPASLGPMATRIEAQAKLMVKALQGQGHMCGTPAKPKLYTQCPTSWKDIGPSVATAFVLGTSLDAEDRNHLETLHWRQRSDENSLYFTR